MEFRVIYEDENYIAVHKPHNIHVHRSSFARKGPFLLQELRNQTGKRLYPVHRLDHAASGVMIFALSHEAASGLCSLMREQRVSKKYIVMVRGFIPDSGVIDTPISDSSGIEKMALTSFRRMGVKELDIPTGKYSTSRYSLVEVCIETGRRHQIRRHLARIAHPVIGDSTYGDIRHNKTISGISGFRRLMLFSFLSEFRCPVTGKKIRVMSLPDDNVMNFFSVLGWREDLMRFFGSANYLE